MSALGQVVGFEPEVDPRDLLGEAFDIERLAAPVSREPWLCLAHAVIDDWAYGVAAAIAVLRAEGLTDDGIRDRIMAALDDQDEQYGAGRHFDDEHWRVLLFEEIGEAARARLALYRADGSPRVMPDRPPGETPPPDNLRHPHQWEAWWQTNLQRELAQTAALFLQWAADKGVDHA